MPIPVSMCQNLRWQGGHHHQLCWKFLQVEHAWQLPSGFTVLIGSQTPLHIHCTIKHCLYVPRPLSDTRMVWGRDYINISGQEERQKADSPVVSAITKVQILWLRGTDLLYISLLLQLVRYRPVVRRTWIISVVRFWDIVHIPKV